MSGCPTLLVSAGAVVAAAALSGLGSIANERTTEPDRSADAYQLVWAEEFDSPGRPSDDNWSYENGFTRNREAQWYQPDNAFVQDGVLVIEARRERRRNPDFDASSSDWRASREFADYTSASLTTKGKHEWTFGRFEMRGRIDIRQGLWPAWWTVGYARPWPGGGEIDMMEYYAGDILANACWKAEGGRWEQHWDTSKTPVAELAGDSTPEQWASEFHVWRMDWTENRIDLYIDDRLLNSIDLSETFNPDGSNPFHEPHYMIVNLALGGTNGGDPSMTEFPARFEVDYIRTYQKTNK